MAALVQSFPQQSGTITMLQTRPASASSPFQPGTSNQRNSHVVRNIYTPSINTAYRGQSTPTSMPYAFSHSSVVTANLNPLRQHPSQLRPENRTSSAPTLTFVQPAPLGNTSNQPRLVAPTLPSMTLASSAGMVPSAGIRDDSYVPTPRTNVSIAPRPLSAMELTLPLPDAKQALAGPQPKPSPDRYRRNRRADSSHPTFAATAAASGGSAKPSGIGMASVGHLYQHPSQASSNPSFNQQSTYRGPSTQGAVDARQPRSEDPLSPELAKRYRRRSSTNPETTGTSTSESRVPTPRLPPQRTYASVVSMPYSSSSTEARSLTTSSKSTTVHRRNGSEESASSYRSSPMPISSKRDGSGLVTPANPTTASGNVSFKNQATIVSVPARGSSDVKKRAANHSPLSKPTVMTTAEPSGSAVGKEQSASSHVNATISGSPAAQQLTALTKRDLKKDGKPSRLRRAFSFGSAAELRKASGDVAHHHAASDRSKLRKEQFKDAEEAQQAAVAQRQEAGGLGEGIYSHQGQFFTGSTDNLSVSSTASSASIMLRKMGQGVKRSTRSLVGLFRPKSMAGVSGDESSVEPSIAQVAMVTVEAERERANGNEDPHDHAGSGTGLSKVEANSIDAAVSSTGERRSDFRTRSAINGGDRERAKVLAAVKKGILKRNGVDSDSPSAMANAADDNKTTDFILPNIPRFNDSPASSAPSTPTFEARGAAHRRTDSVTIEGEDYFMSVAKFSTNAHSKSMPGTPRILMRNISFSPRIQFHDTWTANDYDRRGEIATCNRLTPMLAQQIKEELNSFKMEMEVHESSKEYTHFF